MQAANQNVLIISNWMQILSPPYVNLTLLKHIFIFKYLLEQTKCSNIYKM